jgi:hypothetical protein
MVSGGLMRIPVIACGVGLALIVILRFWRGRYDDLWLWPVPQWCRFVQQNHRYLCLECDAGLRVCWARADVGPRTPRSFDWIPIHCSGRPLSDRDCRHSAVA